MAVPGRKDVGVAADADVVDANGVRQRLDSPDEFAHRVGQLGPHADHTAQDGGLGVDVAERLDLIAFIVQQLKVPEPALVHLFHSLEASFQKCALRSTG